MSESSTVEDLQHHNKDVAGAPRFVQSKWETVDPQDVEAQAMTTSKWDLLENKDALDGVAMADSDDDKGKRGEGTVSCFCSVLFNYSEVGYSQ